MFIEPACTGGVGLVLGTGVRASSRAGRAGPTGTLTWGQGGLLGMCCGPGWTGAVCAEAKWVVSAKAGERAHSGTKRKAHFMVSGWRLQGLGNVWSESSYQHT